MTCSGEVGCSSQHLLYQTATFITSKGHSQASAEDGSWVTYMFFVSILVITAVSATLFGVFSFYCKNKSQLDELQTLEMTDFSSDGSGSQAGPSSKVSSDLFNFFSMGTGQKQGSTNRGPSGSNGGGGDSLSDRVRSSLSSFGFSFSSLTSPYPPSSSSNSSSSGGSFAALKSSSSHSSSGDDDQYDPPTLATSSNSSSGSRTGGKGLLAKISTFSPLLNSRTDYEEEEDDDDDDITVNL
jgi:hypothetical protein